VALVVAVLVTKATVTPAALGHLASSSFPMLAHNNLVAVSLQLMAQTPFTHLQLLALLFQLHLCLHPIWLLQVAQVVAGQQLVTVVEAQGVCCQVQV